MVGKLIYLTVTRLNIVFAVGMVSQYMHTPHQPNWDIVCRFLRYLKNSLSKGILYTPLDKLDVVGYSNVDWAGSQHDK